MATLDTAVTLVEMHDVAVVVAEQLDLDVLGLVEEALDEDGAVAKGRLGLGGCSLEVVLEGGLLAHDTHATAAAAKGSLDDDGEAMLVGEGLDVFVLLDGVGGAGHDGHVALDGEPAGRDLVAKGVDGVWGGADELGASDGQRRYYEYGRGGGGGGAGAGSSGQLGRLRSTVAPAPPKLSQHWAEVDSQ